MGRRWFSIRRWNVSKGAGIAAALAFLVFTAGIANAQFAGRWTGSGLTVDITQSGASVIGRDMQGRSIIRGTAGGNGFQGQVISRGPTGEGRRRCPNYRTHWAPLRLTLSGDGRTIHGVWTRYRFYFTRAGPISCRISGSVAHRFVLRRIGNAPAPQQRPQAVSVNVGMAGAVIGNVQMCVKGKCRKVIPGEAISFNGAIVTGKNSRLQIRFTDKTVLTVGSNTVLVIDKYFFGADPLHIKRGIMRWVSGVTANRIEPKTIKLGYVAMAIRGTDFVVHLTPSTRTLTIELFEGKVSIKPKGHQKEWNLGLGLWTIKWFKSRTGRRYRIRRVRSYSARGDRVLRRRRAYYDRTLPRIVPAGILKRFGTAKPPPVRLTVAGRWRWISRCVSSGKWTGTFTLRGSAANFSGYIRMAQPGGGGKITDGRVVGNQFTFKRYFSAFLGPRFRIWSGTLSANRMVGQYQGVSGTCRFTAQK